MSNPSKIKSPVKRDSRSFRWGAIVALALYFTLPVAKLGAQQGNITTLAGGGPTTMPKLNGAVNNVASTGEIGQIAWDATHQVFYFTSSTFHRVYKYDPNLGAATAFAGNGFNGFGGDGGDASNASFAGPLGLVLDPTNPNLLYVADTGNNRVRRINLASKTVDTLFGSGTCNAGELTSTDVAAASANLCAPGQMTIDGGGVLYVFDLGKSAVWRLSSGQAHMVAGNGTALSAAPTASGTATAMSLGNFGYLAVDAAGTSLYLNEPFGLRQLDLSSGTLSTPLALSGASPQLRDGSPVSVDPATGNVIYAIYKTGVTSENIFVYNPTTGTNQLLVGAGSAAPPYLGPTSNVSLGSSANGLGELVSIAPTGGPAGTFVAGRSGWIHSMDSLTGNPNFLTILGNGFRSYCGDGGPASSACLDSPTSVYTFSDGSVYIADSGNSVVRFVDSNGTIHSLVSPKTASAPPTSITGGWAGSRGGPGALPGPLLFTSEAKNQVFQLDPTNDTTTLVAGSGCVPLVDPHCGTNDDSGALAAGFYQLHGVAADQLGNVFVADTGDQVVRWLGGTQVVLGIYPGTSPNAIPDCSSGGNLRCTTLQAPVALTVDIDNGLIVADRDGKQVVKAPPANDGWLDPFRETDLNVSYLMTKSTNGTAFAPVGAALVPGHVLVSDAGTRAILGVTRSPNYSCASCGTCSSFTPPPPVLSTFAGGGQSYGDNIPATQAAFGSRLVEAGVFDPLDSLAEIAVANINGEFMLYITDRADNRIRVIDNGKNHPPVANAGPDQVVVATQGTAATVTFDGTASSDPDGDVLQFTWTTPGMTTVTGACTQGLVNGLGNHLVTLTVSDGFGGTSTATVNILVISLDLAITATPSASTVNPGDTLIYSATVTNNGPADATGAGVYMLPQTADFVSATITQGSCTGPASGTFGSVQCTIGNLAHGASVSLTITLSPKNAGTLSNTLTVFADQSDSNPANNNVTLVTQVGTATGGGSGGGTGGGGSGGSGSCNCTLTGNYVNPANGVDVAGDPLNSASNKFVVTASIDNANNLTTLTVTRHSDGKVLIPGTTFPITVHWGFSPDENRVAIHSVDIGTQEDEMWVYDLSVAPAKQVVHYRLSVVSDRLQFSPSGQYFLLMALVAQGRSEIDVYRVAGVSTEERVFQTTFPFQSVPGVDEDQYGAVAWGFSPDQPESSFVYAYGNGQSTVSLNVANLTAPHTVPVLNSWNITGVAGFWQFNPCGNLLGVVWQPSPGQVEVDMFNTSDGTKVGHSGETFPVDFVALASTGASEQATVGLNAPVDIATNPGCGSNTPTGSNVSVSPKDPTTGTSPVTVTFSSVTQAGQTSVTTGSSGSASPAGFELGNPPTIYDVTTTATFAGTATICINYSGIAFSGSPQLYHYVNGVWAQITTTVDTVNHVVCGTTSSFSPFALFQPDQAPAFTSAYAATFTAGALGSFTASASGVPTPTLSESGALPLGVSFADNGDGTASLKGTPSSGGAFNITVTASNAEGSVSQSFTLTVNQSPVMTSANSATFTAGIANSFTVSATGYPAVSFSESGALPSGVTLNPATGLLSGTPAAGGIFSFSITASNTAGSVSQSFTLTVNQAPSITSANNATFTAGSAAAFVVAATGFPAPVLGESGALPGGVTFNASTGSLGGTPTSSGSFNVAFTAINAAGTATQSFTLSVDKAPAITTASSAAFTVGVPGSFTVTTTGFPIPSLAESGALPGGISFVDNRNGSATLSGTATASGTFTIIITAANGVGSPAAQSFTLIVSPANSLGLSVTPANIDFGNVRLFQLEARQVTLLNPGTTSIALGKISLAFGAHTNLEDFFFLSSCKSSLGPGKSCVVEVFFFAGNPGAHTAALMIADNASNSPQIVSLAGTAIR